MIPFEELSLALAAWRVKNDLPITEQDQAAVQATMGAAMPPPPPPMEAQEYPADSPAEDMTGADYNEDEAIVDHPPEMDEIPDTGQPALSGEMQVTDSQLVSTDDAPFSQDDEVAAPPMPNASGDFDIDLDE